MGMVRADFVEGRVLELHKEKVDLGLKPTWVALTRSLPLWEPWFPGQ